MEVKANMGKSSTRAQNKYIAKAYDRINLTVPKGQKDHIQAHAEARSESVNGFIGRAISETMERDSSGAAAPCAVQQEAGTAPAGRVVYRVPAADTAESPQEAADFAMETVQEFISRAVIAQSQRDHQPTDMIFLPKDVVKDAFCGGFAFGESARAFIIRAIHELVEKEKPMWDDEVYQLKTLEELAMEGGIVSLPFGALDLMDMGAVPEGGKRPEKLQRTADTLRNKF